MRLIILLLPAVAIGGVGTANAATASTKDFSENPDPQNISYTSLNFVMNF